MTLEHLSDSELAGQPAAYWTGLAYEALIAFTRARQVEAGFTQPQFWLLRNLSAHDLSPDGRGRDIPALREAMSGYLRAEDDLEAEAAVAEERGWLRRDAEGRWWITEAGEAARLDMKRHAPAIRARIHDGIDDADYVTALKVLRRMMANVA
ncbi:MarR family transcriptional regulator [Actinoplanes sp. NEAU-A12]|uniref:MarR family transcriptional regulator n=1 Tax=Actinoplanes sandaracinus TaxID=3045177 RepID=A0ABT6WRD9_9ACTN|nr:MarR family transcriptional regulator [Actinoplanes sandaracinus]MDI6102294.1 MarR family transcriptional regulator [Actinoplanes sandaracinus]